MKIQTVRFGTPVELANTTFTTIDIRVPKYGVTRMDYEDGILTILLKDRKFLVFPANIAFMEPMATSK